MAAFDFPASPTDGQVYTSNGVTYAWSAADTAWKGQGSQVPLSNKQRVIVYPGNAGGGAGNVSATWTKPAGLKQLKVELWGGGGAGQLCSSLVGERCAGNSGGSAAYCMKLYTADQLNATEAIVIGQGGNTPSGVAGAGVASTFKGMTAGQGAGAGATAIGNATSGIGALATAPGGTATGGDVNIQGSGGMLGTWAGTCLPGQGPGSPNGGGPTNNSHPPTGSGGARNGSGTFPGGGACGTSTVYANITTTASGAGGMALLTEYYAEADEVLALPDLVMSTTVIDGNDSSAVNVTGNYAKPAGLEYLQVEIWGGGAAGQDTALCAAGFYAAGGGGGGGGYCKKLYKASDLAAIEAYVVGGGGVASAAAAGPGGNSTFKGMTANGGTNAQAAYPPVATTDSQYSVRGIGGTATGGDVNTPGGHGAGGLMVPPFQALAGFGGHAGGGGGSIATVRVPASASLQVANGLKPGGGGGGSGNRYAGTAGAGGYGAGGRIVFTEYFTELPQAAEPLQEITQEWQPLLRFNNAGVGMVFANQVGGVSKIGSQVVANFDFQLSAKGTSVGGARIVNLPYPIRAGSNVAFTIGYCTGMTAGANQLAGYVSYGTPTELIITKTIVGGTGTANTSDVDFTNATRIIGSISYRTDA